jgi:hypothetical protein
MWPAVIFGGVLASGQAPPLAAQPPSPLNVLVFVPPPAAPPAEAARPAAAATPDRWLLMRELQGTWPGYLLDAHRVSVSGWAETSFTASTDRHDQLPMGFNYLANQGQLQQLWLRVERPVDQAATVPTFGFRSDTFFGIDYRFTVARGLADSQLTADHGQPNQYGYDPVQFYAEAYFPHLGRGTDVKIGRFFCQFGVEVIDATQNQLASHAYNFIYNPFTHTGILATTKLTDAWSVQNGLATGSDVFLAPEANLTYIGSVKWAPPNGRDSALFAWIIGNGRFDQGRQFHNPEILDLIVTHKFNDRLTYTLEALYGLTANVPEIGFANWWATDHYLTYTVSPQVSVTGRLEFFDDVQGQRTGFEGLYVAPTVGLNYRPLKSVIFRPEVRFDYNGESRPFEGKHGVLTAAMDMLVRW